MNTQIAFPLFNEYYTKRKLGAILERKHLSSSCDIPHKHSQVIYLMILHHWFCTHENPTNVVPYGGKIVSGKKMVRFPNIQNLPQDLQETIVTYLEDNSA